MALFKYVGVGPKGEAQERTLDGGFGRGPVTVATGDVFFFAGPVGIPHLSQDLVPHDDDTGRQMALLQEQVNLANARDAAGTSGGI